MKNTQLTKQDDDVIHWDTGEVNTASWQPIETAPKDGRAILLLSLAYDMDVGEANGGVIHVAPKVAIGCWKPDGTSWVDEIGDPGGETYTLRVTGIWLSGGGWFQPNEVTHWCELPLPVTKSTPVDSIPFADTKPIAAEFVRVKPSVSADRFWRSGADLEDGKETI